MWQYKFFIRYLLIFDVYILFWVPIPPPQHTVKITITKHLTTMQSPIAPSKMSQSLCCINHTTHTPLNSLALITLPFITTTAIVRKPLKERIEWNNYYLSYTLAGNGNVGKEASAGEGGSEGASCQIVRDQFTIISCVAQHWHHSQLVMVYNEI